MKRTVYLAAAIYYCLALPLLSQEEPARDALREVTYREYDDRVLAHLLALLPEARDSAQFEATLNYWLDDLHPADTVNVRHRIDRLLRETPDKDLYGILVSLAQFRAQTKVPQTGMPPLMTAQAAATSDDEEEEEEEDKDVVSTAICTRPGEMYINGNCCYGGSTHGPNCRDPHSDHRNPTKKVQYPPGAPQPPPIESYRIIGRVGSQIESARGDCSALQQLAFDLTGASCEPGHSAYRASCRTALGHVSSRLQQAKQESGC